MIPVVDDKIAWSRLRATDFRWLAKNRCSHGSRYIEHSGCFIKEHGVCDPIHRQEKIGFLDTEFTHLSANWGYLLAYCILGADGSLYKYTVTPEEIRSHQFDKNLMIQFLKDIRKFDRLIVYWGRDYRCDVPYLRTRALYWRLNFPKYRDYFINDCYDIVKKKLRLNRGSLKVACDFLKIASKGHPNIMEKMPKVMTGDPESLKYITTHCEEDVYSLRDLWNHLWGFTGVSNASI